MKINFYLIRGLSRESGHWGDFLTYLSKEFPTANFFLLDLPGSGENRANNSPSTIPKIVDFISNKYLVNESDFNIVLASSLGGVVAYEWVMRFPDYFSGIVLMNTSFKPICKNTERVKPKVLFKLLKILLHPKVLKREKMVLEINTNKAEIPIELIEKWVDIQEKRKMSKWNIFMQAIAGHRYRVAKKSIPIPLLMLGSKMDKLVCSQCIQRVHNVFGGTLIWHETAGHCLPLDEPNWVAIQIKNWLIINRIYE
ncbi:MAG: hypothetical protein RL264_2433 [Bacteroidota bacterium]